MFDTITKKQMLDYLQDMLSDYMTERNAYGDDDRIVNKKLNAVIACKEMVEQLIREPVNLQQDGKVTTGF